MVGLDWWMCRACQMSRSLHDPSLRAGHGFSGRCGSGLTTGERCILVSEVPLMYFTASMGDHLAVHNTL